MPLIKETLENAAAKYLLLGGVSDYFSDLSGISGRRMQAMLAMHVGSDEAHGRRVTAFHDYYCEIVGYCAMALLGKPVCVLPSIEALAEKDRIDGSKYMETLGTFLNNLCNYSVTAEKLGLHKNTVYKRMQKIEEMLGAGMDDSTYTDSLFAGVTMHYMSGRIDNFSDKEML
jgi:sugar diacid utilization regulator